MTAALPRLALIPAMLVAAPLYAQQVNTGVQQIEIVGAAPAACVIQGAGASTGVNASFTVTGANSGTVSIAQMADPTTAQPRATSITVQLPVICNSANTLTVRSTTGGLLRVGGNQRNAQQQDAFREFLPYALTANWAGNNVQAASNAGAPLTILSNNGGAGSVQVGFSVPAGGTPLLAGAYADSIIVEFGAAN